MATAIGIVSGPLGILISKILILSNFNDYDKKPEVAGGYSNDIKRAHFQNFIGLHSLITIALVLPALFLIREKPPSPPSMVATKKRPV